MALWDHWWELLWERHTQIWETGILMTTGGLNPFPAAPLLIFCLFFGGNIGKIKAWLELIMLFFVVVRIRSHFNKEKNILFFFCPNEN